MPNLSAFSNWRSGDYTNTNGEYVTAIKRICLNKYVNSSPNITYKSTISGNANYFIVVRELSEDMNYIKSTILGNNATLTTTNETKYLAIVLYNGTSESGITYSTYQTLFNSGFTVSLTQQ